MPMRWNIRSASARFCAIVAGGVLVSQRCTAVKGGLTAPEEPCISSNVSAMAAGARGDSTGAYVAGGFPGEESLVTGRGFRRRPDYRHRTGSRITRQSVGG